MAGRRSSRGLGPEALLAHRAWIERAAHALVLGDADADDLGQQVWVDVLERPPAKEPAHLRSWLRSALRFMSIDAIRARTTRRRHEEAAARRERIDADPADVVARAETLDRVAHAVLELDEPYRTTVLLRWFEDLSPRAIAARQRVPVETVRTRLKRAVAVLRSRLDEDSGGDRRAWCLALLPLIRRRFPVIRTTGLAAYAATGVIMGLKGKAAAVAIALVLLAGGAVVWRGTQGDGAGARSSRVIPVAVRRVAPGETDASPVPAVQGETLDVRVEDRDGKALAGARVEVRPARDGAKATWCDVPLFGAATTDTSGRAAVDLPAVAIAQLREVRVACVGYVTASVRTSEPEFVVRLSTAAAIRGRVYEQATGRGLGGVSLIVTRTMAIRPDDDLESATAEDGSFAVPGIKPGVYTLKVRSPVWLDVDVPDLQLRPGTDRNVEVALRPGITMAGVVKDAATGAPIEKGLAVYRPAPAFGGSKSADLGPGGEFVLRGLKRSDASFAHQQLRLDSEGYDERLSIQTTPAYDLAGNQTRVALLVARRQEGSLTGRVIDPQGGGVPRARVVIGGADILNALRELDETGGAWSFDSGRVKQASTAADGFFRMGAGVLFQAQGNLATERRLLVVHPDFGIVYRKLAMKELTRPIEVRLGSGVRLDVEVVDSAGAPEAGARLRSYVRDMLPMANVQYQGDPFASLQGPTICDGQGRATLVRLCVGEWEIRAQSADGRRWARSTVALDEDGTFACRLILEEAAVVAGKVVDDETDAPLAGVVVGLDGGAMQTERRAATDREGRFEFRGAMLDPNFPGFTLAIVEPPEQGAWASAPLQNVKAGDALVLRAKAVFRDTREISGRVVDAATGGPVPSGLIKCSWRDPKDSNVQQGGFDRRFSEGAFTRLIPIVDGLSLTFRAEEYEPLTLPVEELERANFEVRLTPRTPAAKFGVRVRVAGGEHPNPAARDVAQTAWVHVYDPVTRRERGRWTTGTLPEFVLRESEVGGPGAGVLELQVPGWYQPTPVEFTVDAGRETTIDVTLVRGGGTLGGTSDAKPGARIEITYPTGLKRVLPVGDGGKWWAGQLAPGTYNLFLEDGEPIAVSIGDGDRVQVEMKGANAR